MPTTVRLAWATDIHIDLLDAVLRADFADSIAATMADALVISGDIATSRTLERLLPQLEDRLARPIYFVLGNHDFYRGNIAAVRAAAREMTRTSRWLRWLPDIDAVLREVMMSRADRELLVLCGHTHGAGTAQVLPNLTVRTGGAEYGRPVVQDVLEFV